MSSDILPLFTSLLVDDRLKPSPPHIYPAQSLLLPAGSLHTGTREYFCLHPLPLSLFTMPYRCLYISILTISFLACIPWLQRLLETWLLSSFPRLESPRLISINLLPRFECISTTVLVIILTPPVTTTVPPHQARFHSPLISLVLLILFPV